MDELKSVISLYLFRRQAMYCVVSAEPEYLVPLSTHKHPHCRIRQLTASGISSSFSRTALYLHAVVICKVNTFRASRICQKMQVCVWIRDFSECRFSNYIGADFAVVWVYYKDIRIITSSLLIFTYSTFDLLFNCTCIDYSPILQKHVKLFLQFSPF